MYALAASCALVLEITWLSHLGAGVPVDPLLVVVMSVGLLHGPEEGAVIGAGAGLLEDIMAGVPLGLGMLGGVAVGFCAGLGQRSINVDNVWLPGLAAAVLTLLRHAVWTGTAHVVGLLNAPLVEVAQVAVLAACYNGIVAVPVFHGFRRLDDALVKLYDRRRSA
jgi:rod shape-determining protein MreD